MRIVEVVGGLGNQMFQYAFAMKLKHIFNDEDVCISLRRFGETVDNDGYQLEQAFSVSPKHALLENIARVHPSPRKLPHRWIRKICPHWLGYFRERAYRFDPVALHKGYGNLIYYSGLWQDERYFADISEDVYKAYTFRNPDLRCKHYRELYSGRPIVSLHVRRGDYIDNPKYCRILGGVCSDVYYGNAVNIIESKVDNPVYCVFSDEPKWAMENLSVLDGRSVVSATHIDGSNCFADMSMMSQCDHHIIANSTYSWWGAWLNHSPQKIVVAPDRWFKGDAWLEDNHVVPDSWIKAKTE